MSSHSTSSGVLNWRTGLPALEGQVVSLREPTLDDVPAIRALLSLPDAPRFGLEACADEPDARRVILAAVRDRAAGTAFTYAITGSGDHTAIGLIQMRRLDPTFESAEMECTLAPASRGTGAFVDAARLAISFAFDTAGIHRVEVRVIVEHGRAHGALRKLGAVHEGILRRAIRRGNEYFDQALWALLKDDWSSQWMPDAPRVH